MKNAHMICIKLEACPSGLVTSKNLKSFANPASPARPILLLSYTSTTAALTLAKFEAKLTASNQFILKLEFSHKHPFNYSH